MKNTLKASFLLLIILAHHLSFAQQLTVKTGETQNIRNGALNFEIVNYQDQNLVVLNKTNTVIFNDNYEIDYLLFDKDLNITKNIELKIPKNKYSTNVDYLNVFVNKNKFNLLTSYINSSKKSCYIFSNSINSSGIVEADFNKVNEYSTPSNKYVIKVSYSPDSSKIAVFTWDAMKSFKDKNLDCCVLDKDFNLIWKKEFIMPLKESDFRQTNYLVNNDGKAFILGKLDNKSKDKNAPDELLTLVTFESSSNNASVLSINESLDLNDYLLTFDPNHNLHLIATISKIKKGRVSHLKNVIIDTKTNSIKNNSTIEIPAYFYDGLEKTTAEAIGIKNFDLCNVLYKPEGGYYILAEQMVFTESVGGGPYGGGGGTSFYTNNNTYVFNIDKSNSSILAVQIPKNQKSTNDQGRYNSFYSFQRNGSLYTIHNEHKDNPLDINSTSERVTLRKNPDARLVLSEIKNDGSITQKFIANKNNPNIVFLPSTANLMNNNKLLLFGEKMVEGIPVGKNKECTLGEIDLIGK